MCCFRGVTKTHLFAFSIAEKHAFSKVCPDISKASNYIKPNGLRTRKALLMSFSKPSWSLSGSI